MQPFAPKVPTRSCSNLVFGCEGQRVFWLDAEGALRSAVVPCGRTGAVQLEPSAWPGAVIAVGWLEGRLATIALREGHLELSHGEYGVNLAPSRAARVPLAAGGLRLEAGGRLEPYARWWQEVNSQEGLFGGISLVRDVHDRLHAVAAWCEEGATKWSVSVVADRVAAIAPRDDEHTALFVGEVAPALRSGMKRSGIFLLSRRLGGSPELVESFDAPPARAFIGPAGRRDALVAVELAPSKWSFFRVDAAHGCERLPDVVRATHGDILGALVGASGSPALVLCDEAKHTLSLALANGTSRLASSPGAIAEAAVSPAAPVVAYLTSEGEVQFAWSVDA